MILAMKVTGSIDFEMLQERFALRSPDKIRAAFRNQADNFLRVRHFAVQELRQGFSEYRFPFGQR